MKMRGDWKIDRAAQAIDYDGDIVSLLSVDAIKSGVPIPAPSAPKKQPPPPQKIAPNPPLSSFSFSVLFTFQRGAHLRQADQVHNATYK